MISGRQAAGRPGAHLAGETVRMEYNRRKSKSSRRCTYVLGLTYNLQGFKEEPRSRGENQLVCSSQAGLLIREPVYNRRSYRIPANPREEDDENDDDGDYHLQGIGKLVLISVDRLLVVVPDPTKFLKKCKE